MIDDRKTVIGYRLSVIGYRKYKVGSYMGMGKGSAKRCLYSILISGVVIVSLCPKSRITDHRSQII